MDSSDLDRHLLHGYLGRNESARQTVSLLYGSVVFTQLTRVPNTHTDTQTTLLETYTAACRIYAMYTTRPNNNNNK